VTTLKMSILTGAFLAGMVLGGIFFGGLWLTIRHTLSSAALGLWLTGSFMLRTVIVLAGFYVIFAGDAQRLIASLIGFVLARFMVARALQVRSPDKCASVPKASHAP
jgi:F1F0 ATPase subunit 2